MIPRSFLLLKLLCENGDRRSEKLLIKQLCILHSGCVRRHTSSLPRPISWSPFQDCQSSRRLPLNKALVWSRTIGDNVKSNRKEALETQIRKKAGQSDTPVVDKQCASVSEEKVNLAASPDNATATSSPDDQDKAEGKSVAEVFKEAIVNKVIPPKPRPRVDLTAHTLERNFITPVRAMTDFLLKPAHLEELRKTKRRSPYENEPPITVYWRADVERKALEVWGSRERLEAELKKRAAHKAQLQEHIFNVKRHLLELQRKEDRREMPCDSGLMGSSGKVVLTAIAINGSNFLFKLFAWLYTGSHSMFAESIHSLADTINQLILAYGIHKSVQRADSDHPYGYTNMRYVASLISGVGIFCVGTGLSIYHGITGLLNPAQLEPLYWAFFILGGSLVSEGATLLVAVNSIKKGAKSSNMTFWEYVLRGQDPSVNVVLMEDLAAVVSVGVAGVCMGIASYYGTPIPDAIGSLLVGGILGGVASFIIYTNVAALIGRSISQKSLEQINLELESDVMIRAIHDVKGVDMGNCLVRYKAEVDFDGRELTRNYLDKQDMTKLLEEVKSMNNVEEFENFMLKHGENIVDSLGGEIDRIETKLRQKHPEIRHCDLEIL
ncbi:proton-coupled zinc antiporter SLC30A9, mitochondrial isoform X2 [Anabrus simplex]|uniref:proton-coupled zinc antiporter SLC30A9, mitochondrial isoform X2 n=1 Tax=Anabrus simplex TaxID=316456 RepID=UPI0035A3872E